MLLDAVLILVLIICFITDFMKQRIYNVVIFPSLLAVIVINTLFYGLSGIKMSLLGLLTGFAILLIPYFLGGMGAGDVKLLAFIGAAKGSIFVLNTAVYMAITGGIIALIIIVFRKQTISFFKSLFLWLFSFFSGVKYKLEFPTSSSKKLYPYGTAIVLGALICLFFKEAWII